MRARLLASGLGFAEGPVLTSEGALVFCDGNIGELSIYEAGRVRSYARTGGSPWGSTLGADNAIYVTQGGWVPGSPERNASSGIQRVWPDRTVELLFSELAGQALFGPNDLAFGSDARLYFTDSGSETDSRFTIKAPGRLFAASDAGGEMLLELPDVYPNGIAFDAEGVLYWTESNTHRICRLENGVPATFSQLPETHRPDGMAFARDGRLFVATTTSGGVTVVAPDGEVLDQIDLGEGATNCAFSQSTLFVTATRARDIEASQRTGTLWAIETDAVGLRLHSGSL